MHGTEQALVIKYKFIAMFYDLLFGCLENIVFMNPRNNPRRALAGALRGSSLKIVDVCCGTGRSSLAIARTGNSVTGIDLSPDMLARARKKMEAEGLRTVTLHRMNAAAMDFPDGAFDAATISFGLHEMRPELMLRVLGEMRRVLRNGGKLLIVDYGRDERLPVKLLFSLYVRLCYPAHVRKFLDHAWPLILGEAGFHHVSTERFPVSRMICAVKQDGGLQ